jgi:hypothetical protein
MDMANVITVETRQFAPMGDSGSFNELPLGRSEAKLERLLELRAVIEGLRHERGSHLLLDWAAETQNSAVR